VLFDTLAGAQKIAQDKNGLEAPTRPCSKKLEGRSPGGAAGAGSTATFEPSSKSTYVDGAASPGEPRTAALHTDFKPGGDATGRLSSKPFPTLQETSPSATQFSRRIPQAFPAQEGWQLISADLLPDRAGAIPHATLRRRGAAGGLRQRRRTCNALTAACYSTKPKVDSRGAPPGQNNQLALIYGMGAQALRTRETGVSQRAAKEVSLENTKSATPGFSVFWSCRSGWPSSRLFVGDILGRRRPFGLLTPGLAG